MEIPFEVRINKTVIQVVDLASWRQAVTRGEAFFAAIMGDEYEAVVKTPTTAVVKTTPETPEVPTPEVKPRRNQNPPPPFEGPTKAEIAEEVLREGKVWLKTADLAAAMVAKGWITTSPVGEKRNRTLENPLARDKDKFAKVNGAWGLTEWLTPERPAQSTLEGITPENEESDSVEQV